MTVADGFALDAVVEPITRPPNLVDTVAEQVRQLLLEGVIPADVTLRQEHLAKQLGVSRTPLRAALVKLENEGLVKISPTGQASVVSLAPSDARELMEIREVLDGLAARSLGLRGMTDEDKIELENTLARMTAANTAGDRATYLRANTAFHTKIVKASSHRYLRRLISLVTMSCQVSYLVPGDEAERFASSAAEHRAIFLALVRRAAGEAELLAREHVRQAADYWIR